jgi:hypothetical protein
VERWRGGIDLRPYPAHTGDAHDPEGTGTFRDKATGVPAQNQAFYPFTAYVADSCSTFATGPIDEYKARIMAVFTAVESAIVAEQLLTASIDPTNIPHLADGNGDFPNGDSPVSLLLGLALLEEAIGASHRAGVIHMSQKILTMFSQTFALDTDGRRIFTLNGTTVVADAGYAGGGTPASHSAAGATQEWIYATGPIDVRRGAAAMLPPPEDDESAIDRTTNDVTYRAERDYVLAFDAVVQAAVLVDYCQDDCS